MKMETSMREQLGHEPVGKLLLRLALPAVMAQIANLLYNVVDRVYIGLIPGSGAAALTGIGVCMPLMLAIVACASLIDAGGGPRASILSGAGKMEEARHVLGNCFVLLLLAGALITAVTLLFNRPILLAIGASSETLPYALTYMNAISVGALFFVLALGLNPFIVAQGCAKTAMATTLVGAVCNVLLDPFFIFVLDMGVLGAALATVISQAFSAVWVLVFIFGKRNAWRFGKAQLRLQRAFFLPCLALGLAPFTMSITESMLSACFNWQLQYFGGDMAVTAMTVFTSVMQFVKLPINGITQGAQPIISYSYGAGNKQRVKKAFRLLVLVCAGWAAAVWLLVMLFPQLPAMLFIRDAALLTFTATHMRIYMATAFLIGIQMACQQTFVALGNAKMSFFLAVLRKLILLIPLIFILPRIMDDPVKGIYLAEPIADVMAVTTTVLMFRAYFKRVILPQR